jgi:hypothetical protein
MTIYLSFTIGLLISLSVFREYVILDSSHQDSLSHDIKEEMEKRFNIRDTFKEKGNSGKYLKLSHMQP